MSGNQDLVRHFHRIMGFDVADMPTVRKWTERDFRMGLIAEEFQELDYEMAITRPDVVKIAHECADIGYTLYGLAVEHGFDLDAVFREVHRANMTKDPHQGGKALKGEGFRPADVGKVLNG